MTASTDRYHGLDALRGIAASLIVAVHSMNILPLGPGYEKGNGYDLVYRYFVMGVPLFFIISAFSLSAAYAPGLGGAARLRRYAIRRIFRIAPLFYAILAAWLGYFHYLGSPPRDGATLLANFSFTFSLFPSTQTSIVPAGWSIGVEMLFYACFPLFLMIRGAGAMLVLFVASLLASWAWNQPSATELPGFYYWTHPVTNAPYFVLGLLAWRVLPRLASDTPRLVSRLLLGGGVLLLAAMIAFGPVVNAQQTYTLPVSPVLVAGWGAGFFAIALSQAIQPSAVLVNPVTTFLGRISYSLYLVHPLVIYATGVTVWLAARISPPFLGVPVIVMAIFALTIPVASLLYLAVERPFIALGRRLAP